MDTHSASLGPSCPAAATGDCSGEFDGGCSGETDGAITPSMDTHSAPLSPSCPAAATGDCSGEFDGGIVRGNLTGRLPRLWILTALRWVPAVRRQPRGIVRGSLTGDCSEESDGVITPSMGTHNAPLGPSCPAAATGDCSGEFDGGLFGGI